MGIVSAHNINIIIKNYSRKLLKIESSNSKSIQVFFQVENKLLCNSIPNALADRYESDMTEKIHISLSKQHLHCYCCSSLVALVEIWGHLWGSEDSQMESVLRFSHVEIPGIKLIRYKSNLGQTENCGAS